MARNQLAVVLDLVVNWELSSKDTSNSEYNVNKIAQNFNMSFLQREYKQVLINAQEQHSTNHITNKSMYDLAAAVGETRIVKKKKKMIVIPKHQFEIPSKMYIFKRCHTVQLAQLKGYLAIWLTKAWSSLGSYALAKDQHT